MLWGKMDIKIRQRSVYPTAKQKRKLFSLMAQHPQLISFKVSPDFNQADSQALWNKIAAECNSLPGARKTWRQWRKTWQDMRCKVKKKQLVRSEEILTPLPKLTNPEREALGLKNVSSTTNYHNTVEFVAPEEESTEEINLNSYIDAASYSEPGSPPEVKVEVTRVKELKNKKIKSSNSSSHGDCVFNCDRLAVQEQRKIDIKEDYYNFKKDYLKQKLLMIKEQTEALKNIAKELAK